MAAPTPSEPLPSMQMYATWREKRVQRFSSGVERMRSRLKELQEEREEAVPGAGPSELAGVRPPTINHTDGLAAELISSGVLYQTAANDAPVKDTPTSLSAACRTIVYSLVEVASLQGELNAANRTSEEINRMAQSQLVEAAQAMRKMKQHVEQLARTKRHYESTIRDMSEKLTKAEKANLELRNRKPEKSAADLASADELAASRKEIDILKGKLAKTEENCQRVLARIGVSGDESRVGVGTGPTRATSTSDAGLHRPGSAPARVRFPPIKGASSAVNDDDSKKSSEHTGPAAGVASSRPAGAMHHLYDASPPTAKEISEYAQFLGLNPETEEEFLWIAEEALCAPLPAGWSEHYKEEYGAVYYFNAHTKESSWNHPLEAYYRTLLESLKDLVKELRLVQATGNSLFAVSRIGSQANAVMKAHNEKMASLLLDEDPAARHKPAHMSSTLPQNAATTAALMDELKAETQEALAN